VLVSFALCPIIAVAYYVSADRLHIAVRRLSKSILRTSNVRVRRLAFWLLSSCVLHAPATWLQRQITLILLRTVFYIQLPFALTSPLLASVADSSCTLKMLASQTFKHVYTFKARFHYLVSDKSAWSATSLRPAADFFGSFSVADLVR
jgi:hypothetical protein